MSCAHFSQLVTVKTTLFFESFFLAVIAKIEDTLASQLQILQTGYNLSHVLLQGLLDTWQLLPRRKCLIAPSSSSSPAVGVGVAEATDEADDEKSAEHGKPIDHSPPDEQSSRLGYEGQGQDLGQGLGRHTLEG